MEFKNGKPVFGKDIFEMPKGIQKRVIFTYNYRAKMKLGWDKIAGMIIFDFLERVPTLPATMEGNQAPSTIFDGLDWDGTVWKYKHNIDIKQPPANSRKTRFKTYPY